MDRKSEFIESGAPARSVSPRGQAAPVCHSRRRLSLAAPIRDSGQSAGGHRAGIVLACLGIAAVVGLPGCRWWPRQKQSDIPVYTEDLTRDELVRALNANIEPLSGWRCTNATVRTRGNMMGVLGLNAHIAVERSRNFRMLVRLMQRNMADLGSNDERFWFWFDGHPQERTFTARHAEAEYAQQVLQIPFEPDWLMEALGVVPLNPDEFEMIGDGSSGTVSLVSERMTSSGRIVRRVVLVDVRHRLILAHALYDGSSRTQGWIAKATLRDHRIDSATGLVLPREIDLEWPQADLFLTITLNDVQVNPRGFPESTFALPQIDGYPAYEIAAPSTFPGGNAQSGLPFHAGSQDAPFAVPDDGGAAYISDANAPYAGPDDEWGYESQAAASQAERSEAWSGVVPASASTSHTYPVYREPNPFGHPAEAERASPFAPPPEFDAPGTSRTAPLPTP